MKKMISFLSLTVMMLSLTLTVFAGDVPESLMYEDGAQIFFAEVLYYHPDKENPDIEFSPTKKIKGDVKIGTKQIAYQPNPVGDFDIKVGNVYLFIYFDESNPTYIFGTTSQDTATLKLKNTTGDMWDRFEEYLNDGRYEEAELERTGKLENAQKIRNAKVFSELFLFDRNDVEKIEVVYPGDGDPAGCYVDKDKFYDIVEKIPLVKKDRIDELNDNYGVWIIAVDKNNNRNGVWLNEKAGVGCSLFETSSGQTIQFEISNEDYIKLYAFLPEEATAHIPLENPMKNYVMVAIGFALLVCIIGFVIGFTIKKKKRTSK